MSIRPLRSTSNGKLPRDTVPWDNLALRYEGIGQHEKALADASEAMRLDPRDSYAYQNLGDVYERLNRYDEAKVVLEKAIAQGTGADSLRFTLYELAFIQQDQTGMQRQVEEIGRASCREREEVSVVGV